MGLSRARRAPRDKATKQAPRRFCPPPPPPQGAATVKRLLPSAVFVFLTAESEKALVERLLARKTETPEKLVVRAATAREEAARLGEFDYVVVNAQGQLDRAVRGGTDALLCLALFCVLLSADVPCRFLG